MKITQTKRNTYCEHCGTPISNVFIVEEPETDFLIRVGSSCIKHFVTFGETGVGYVVKELGKAEKFLSIKKQIEKAYHRGDHEELERLLGKRNWRANYENLDDAAIGMMAFDQRRYEERVSEVNEKLSKKKVWKEAREAFLNQKQQ